MPSGIGSAASDATAAVSIGPLELRVWPCAGTTSGDTSSLPVERIATRGRAVASTCVAPASAAAPTPAAVRSTPAGRISCPTRKAAARRATCCPGRNRGSCRRTRPPACAVAVPSIADSTGMTASAPDGTGAPVMIRAHAPQPIPSVVTSPAARSTITSSSTGPPDRPARSLDRTAKPSIMARSQGGESTSDTTAAASLWPTASSSRCRRGGNGTAVCSTSSIALSRSSMSPRHTAGEPLRRNVRSRS